MVVLFFILWRISILFFKVDAPIYNPPAMNEGSLFSTSLPVLLICCLLDTSHPDRSEMISHCGFDLHFPDDEWCWTSFHVPLGLLLSSLERCLFRFSAHFFQSFFFFFNVSCMSHLCILDISPFSDISFANIFSQSVGRPFVLLILSFTV